MKGYTVHGQLQDYIDYKALIELQANTVDTFHVVAARRPQKSYRSKNCNKKRKHPLKMLKK